MFSTRVHRPTVEFQPMIEDWIQAWSRTVALAMMTHRWSLTPGPILAPGPMTTLGPIRAVGSISAVYTHATSGRISRGSYARIRARRTYGIGQDVSSMYPLVLLGVGKQRRVGSGEVGEVEAGTREVILGLTDVHPEPLQVKRVELVVGSDGGEDLLLDRGRSELSHQHDFCQSRSTDSHAVRRRDPPRSCPRR